MLRFQCYVDSGFNSAIIRENLIQPEQLTCNSLYCTLADGTRRKFQVTVIEVKTPYFIGKIEAYTCLNLSMT